MAKVASTPIDVILGEAVHGSRAQRFRDMVAIASVMHNRSQQLGKPVDKIVSVRSEFNAYGKALPRGVEGYRSLAQQAWDHVEKNGPVHDATFYATPAATKNLPKGLSPVTTTTGHQYFKDPQGRAIRTADGFVRPTQASLPTNVPLPTERPTEARGPGLAALAPNGLRGRPGSMTFYNEGQSSIASPLADAVTGLSAEFGQNIGITSGYRSPEHNKKVKGAKNSFHVQGKAVDIDMRGWSPEKRQRAVQEMAQRGAGGFITYSETPDMLHVDMRSAPGGPVFMHDRKGQGSLTGNAQERAKAKAFQAKAPGWFKEMARPNALTTPRGAVPTPTERPGSPLSPVERGAPLSPAPTTRNFPTLGGERTVLSPTPGDRLAPAPASRLGPAASPRLVGTTPGETPPIVASRYTLGGPVSLPPDRPMPGGPIAGSLPQQQPAPPLSAPQTVNAPPPVYQTPAPLNPMQAAVDAAPFNGANSFPEAPNIPRGSQAAYDFYNGMNDQAVASTGEALNRDPYGRTYITNKYGVTTGTDARGNSFRASSIPGPLGDNPQQDKPSILGADWQEMGQKARPILGGAIGGGLGGLLGPAGAALGGLLGKELSKPGGGRIGAFVRGERTIDTSNVPGFGKTTNFARPQGGLAFPSAPSGGGGTQKYSDRDYSRMEKVSPKAARDIKSGKSGLY